jgi:hypothetical protein
MTCQISLDEREHQLLLDLLHKEQRLLRTEVHRADGFEAKRILQERLESVERLAKRLGNEHAVAAS